MTKWEPAPKEERFTILRMQEGGTVWEPCDFLDLRPGDIFKALYKNEPVDPATGDPGQPDDRYMATGAPFKNLDLNQGFRIEIELLDKAGAN